ncbi:cation transporter [Moniliophthora roreri MCA 2997]|uniref:Cation transporter n=1 Tax=Moniliophthora roreri (strain MCA 2997) TaxID=1381753 RepID=V2XZG1_MONRO|nr:cation transporter [Moniliophthora roreri MCA 2997]
MAEPLLSLLNDQVASNARAPSHRAASPSLDPAEDPDGQSDIYRGSEPHSPRPSPSPSTSSLASSSSSSSWGRLRGFAQVVSALENALSRWGGSSSSSSTSSQSSLATTPRSQLVKRRRKKRYPGSVYSLQSDMEFAARLSLVKARAESRHIPRHFNLYLPPSLHNPSRTRSSKSLSEVILELETYLRKATKTRKAKDRNEPKVGLTGPLHHHFMLPDSLVVPSQPASYTDLKALRSGRKGKNKESQEPTRGRHTSHPAQSPKAWFLDVASPTWEDMRSLGRLLHLHPLTLEDILQQEPREKLEIFPRLGYSFISFRAFESRDLRETVTRHPNESFDTLNDPDDNEGLLQETNVYLIIFNEGLCIFHFTDISEHTARIHNRIVSLGESINMSSAWIAHGLLDSIVDSFFPLLDDIEKEVLSIEELVYNGQHDVQLQDEGHSLRQHISKLQKTLTSRKASKQTLPEIEKHPSLLEKENAIRFTQSLPKQTRFFLPRPPLSLLQKRIARFVKSRWRSSRKEKAPTPPSTTLVNLRRIARTRRLVTSLTRLLASKADVVAQIQKRMLIGLGSPVEDVEVSIYMGDVQDHILTLQHSLAHYERLLSQSYPVYLAQLRTLTGLTKMNTDKALIILTTVSVAVLSIQSVTAIFSMNINVPHNLHEPGSPFTYFGIVVCLASVVLAVYLFVVRHWWRTAKRRRGLVLRNR